MKKYFLVGLSTGLGVAVVALFAVLTIFSDGARDTTLHSILWWLVLGLAALGVATFVSAILQIRDESR